MKTNSRQAKRCLEEIRQLVSKTRSPFVGMSKEEAIEEMRKVREKLWEEKLAARH